MNRKRHKTMFDPNDIELLVTSIKEISSKRRLISINYEPAFALYISEVRNYNIAENKIINAETYDEIVNQLLKKRATARAMNLLQSKDYTEKELIRKLKSSYYPEESIDAAVTYVKKFGYIDDERYTDNYIYYKAKDKSKYQIVQFLLGKGIDRSMIDNAYAIYDESHKDSELNTIVQLMRKKNKDYANLTANERTNVLASYFRKGFQIDLIKKALDIVVQEGYNY